jgi:8-oxo-dGTP diphosphatase
VALLPGHPARADRSAAVALIAAAGGLVWRPDGRRRLVCLVHRPRYDDWSLPKGSVRRGEHPLAAAVREVAEETGLRGVPRLPLPSTRYAVAGVPKVVEYWAMWSAGGQEFRPNSEVDQVAWLPVGEAVRRVRYPHDAGLLRDWEGLPPVTGVVLLVRHADAGERREWAGPDHARPLSDRGAADAAAMCRLLALFAPTRLVSATPDRCRQTVAPLGAAHRPVEVEPAFDETTGDPAAAANRIWRLAGAGGATVVCTQRTVIPPVLARLSEPDHHRAGSGTGCAGRGGPPEWTTGKGDGWLLSFSDRRVLAVAPLRVHQVRR